MPYDASFLTPLADGFRIGEWTVLPRSHEMSRPGETVHVEPKPMQVLTLLAAHAGEPVTRDELLEAVWSEVYVTENALSRCISQLRKLFDDDARTPRVIETIPTVGYRLIAPVHHLGDGVPVTSEASDFALSVTRSAPVAEPEAEAMPGAVGGRDSRFRWQMGLAWGFVALALAALAVLSVWGGGAKPVEPVTRPLTSAPGRETSPALSPDGSRVLYVHAAPGERGHLFVRVLGEGRPLQLTDGDGSDASPAWAPDGRTVAFVRCEAEGCGLFAIPALGGEARRLTDAPAFPWGLAFAPDGQTLAFVTRDTSGAPARLAQLDLATGTHRPLTDPPPTSGGDIDPVFAPDGRTILFRRRTGGGGEDLYRLALPDGSPERLTHDDRSLAGTAFSRDGREVLFSSNRTGMYELWRMPAAGGALERVRGVVARDPGQPEVGDGRLVFEEWAFEINLWVRRRRQRRRPASRRLDVVGQAPAPPRGRRADRVHLQPLRPARGLDRRRRRREPDAADRLRRAVCRGAALVARRHPPRVPGPPGDDGRPLRDRRRRRPAAPPRLRRRRRGAALVARRALALLRLEPRRGVAALEDAGRGRRGRPGDGRRWLHGRGVGRRDRSAVHETRRRRAVGAAGRGRPRAARHRRTGAGLGDELGRDRRRAYCFPTASTARCAWCGWTRPQARPTRCRSPSVSSCPPSRG